MPRKSTASMASATPAMDTNGEASVLSNAPPTNSPLRPTTKVTNTDPISPSKPKAQAHLSKMASERPGRKSAGNAELEEGNVEKVVKVAKPKNDDMTIDDLLLPRSLVSRLSRGSLPPNTSLQKDALLALTKSATVFISYLAHTANSLTSRKTIQAADVLEAIREIELQGIMEARLEEEIQLFDEGVKGKRKGYRDRVKARESTGTNAGQDDNADDIDEAEADGRGPSQSKRIRRAEEDVEMDNAPSSASRPIFSRRRDPDETDPSAQLRAEAARASDGNTPYQKGVSEQAHRIADVDTIDPDSDAPVDEDDEGEPQDEEDDEEDDEEEEDDDPEDEDDEEGNEDDEEVDEEEKNRRKEGEMLAPNGRVEIGSEDESD